MSLDNRNVLDKYKHMPNWDIKDDLDSKRFNYSVVACNQGNTFNVGSMIRNANAFGAKEFVLYGRSKYDKRSSLGTHNYIDIIKLKDIYELRQYAWSNSHIVVGIEQDPASTPYTEFDWTQYSTNEFKLVLVFGSEDNGLTEDERVICDYLVSIPQYGSVRSLNVACASSIIMSYLTTQFVN